MTTTRAVGAQAEALAARHLERAGYRILARNFTVRQGELDLVAAAPDGTLCFVEVRARASEAYGTPAETVGPRKQARLVAAARVYLTRLGREPACRFDVIEVTGDGRAAGAVRHIVDAFRLGDG